MSKICKYCGMESEDDRVCSWCGKPLTDDTAQTPAKPTPAADTGPSAPARTRRKSTAGAAVALSAAEAARRATPKWPYYLAGVVGFILVVIISSAIAMTMACRPPQEPAQWQRVQSETGELSLEVPADWKFASAGSTGSFEWVRLRGAKLYTITIKGTQAMGAMGDIAGVSGRLIPGDAPLEKQPEGKLHIMLGAQTQKSDPNYKEDQMQPTGFALVPAAYSMYTTKRKVGVFSVSMKGWRLSAPGVGDYSYNMRAECPAKHWDKFEPIAYHIRDSITRGGD